ncbi:MAG TPA: F0F1 ATP synthase subunit B [Gammaproteobacteria bacterium]|nr:F0F1 ATP synthase subunit B [Gammaproteobacteria bacterium]
MNLNATLFGQMITFAIFVWFTMRVIWPILSRQLDERKRIIANGLAAGEEGRRLLASAEEAAKNKIDEAKTHCYKLLEEADQEAAQILENARVQARKERDDILAAGHVALDREVTKAKNELQDQVVNIAMLGAEKILQRSVNAQDNQEILQQLAKNLV